MNTNLLNQSTTIQEKFIKSIPVTEFYSNILTRPKIANLYDKYFLSGIYQLAPEQALRALMVNCFRYINMSIQDVTVLLVYGLDGLSRQDLDLTDKHLSQKLAMQNPDKNDIDVINRIIAQVVTKLPADLRERLVPQLRIRMIQKLNGDLQIMFSPAEQKEVLSPASVMEPRDRIQDALKPLSSSNNIKEGFQANNNLLLNNSTELTSLKNNFLKEMADVEASLGKETIAELEKQGYSPESLTKSAINMNIGAGDYETQLRALNSLPTSKDDITTGVPKKDVIPAKYYQEDPQLHMDAKTKELYYFDEYSGVLVPVKDVKRIKGEEITTEKQLNTILKDHDLTKKETDDMLDELQEPVDAGKSLTNKIENVLMPDNKNDPVTTTGKKEGFSNAGLFGDLSMTNKVLVTVFGVALVYLGWKAYSGKCTTSRKK